ncbi:hypothetical protein HF638_24440 [Paenibacillus sp. SZ31]|uniref:hypothetical protein n=1 Tax=Paenibacillus sp. SZ31 TaxID=2725555 RepID=UPI00146C6D17|nr:hypothetical protein [Paenibacillus sp. SZ31]NMI07145.1 hypothetical protein [Paenibacillus sp. SZ31]
MNKKKIAIVTLLGVLSIASAAYAGSGKASNVSISYYQTYSEGNLVPMYETVSVSGYVNPTHSDNSVWYELHKSSGSIVREAEAQVGFSGTLFSTDVATADYRLDLNPDGPNYYGVVANGKAQN